jgi:hypothetical protein
MGLGGVRTGISVIYIGGWIGAFIIYRSFIGRHGYMGVGVCVHVWSCVYVGVYVYVYICVCVYVCRWGIIQQLIFEKYFPCFQKYQNVFTNAGLV